MNYTQVFYWITVADSIKSALDVFSDIFTTLFAVSGLAYIFCFIGKTSSIEEKQCKSVEEEKTSPQVRAWQNILNYISKIFYTSLVLSLVLWIAWAAVPTKKDGLLIIAGGQTLNYLSTDSSAKKLPSEALNYVVVELQSMAKEAKVDLGISNQKDKIIEEAKNMTASEIIEKMKIDSNFAKIITDK